MPWFCLDMNHEANYTSCDEHLDITGNVDRKYMKLDPKNPRIALHRM